MKTPAELISANSANIVGIVNDTELHHSAAELTLRNTAVASDRLGFSGFSRLRESAQATLTHAAQVADTLAPGSPEDKEKFRSESYGEWQYRISVESPLHRLQEKVAHLHFSGESIADDKLRYAINVCGEAFAAVLEDAGSDPAITETFSYFQGNIDAAGRAIGRTLLTNIDDL